MAWSGTYSTVVSGVSKEQIWKAWSEVNNWHLWDSDIEFAKLDEPFHVGSSFVLKPRGGPRVKLKFVKVENLRAYTDFTQFPLAKMYGIHEMQEVPGGLELNCRIEVQGPLAFVWRKIVAEGVVNGLAKQTSSLVEYAKKMRP